LSDRPCGHPKQFSDVRVSEAGDMECGHLLLLGRVLHVVRENHCQKLVGSFPVSPAFHTTVETVRSRSQLPREHLLGLGFFLPFDRLVALPPLSCVEYGLLVPVEYLRILQLSLKDLAVIRDLLHIDDAGPS
jgi:hypothetical protein